jgi:hypothetical protein
VSSWLRWGREQANLEPRQILLVTNAGPGAKLSGSTSRLPPPLDKLPMVPFALDDPDHLKHAIVDFAGILFGFHPDAEFLDD